MWKRGIMAMKMELRTTWDEKMENRNISNWMRLNLPSINSVSVTCCPQLLIHCVKSQYVLKLLLHHTNENLIALNISETQLENINQISIQKNQLQNKYTCMNLIDNMHSTLGRI